MRVRFEDLDTEAMGILSGNDRGRYTVPTDGLYPYQWNWDSAFAAFGFSQFDLDRAWVEMETLFSGQWPNGMVPHILFHEPDDRYFPGPEVWGCNGPIPSSGISQPPVATTLIRGLWERDKEYGEGRLRRLFPRLLAWHRWFMTWRLDQGAVCVTHPWEAGRDNAPDWDAPLARIDPSGVGDYQRRDTNCVDPSMRPTDDDYDRYIWLVNLGRNNEWNEAILLNKNPFRMADPTLTFVLLRATRDLLVLGRALDQDASEIFDWIKILEAGAGTLWNDEIESYDSRDVHTGAWSGCISNASFLCWFAGIHDGRMLKHLRRVLDAVPYGIPSHDPDSDRFESRRYWRGPTWPIMNRLIGIGLEEAGLQDEAEKLRQITAKLIAGNGFTEYFDPHDGSPAGGSKFTWTAAVWLGWASPNARRE